MAGSEPEDEPAPPPSLDAAAAVDRLRAAAESGVLYRGDVVAEAVEVRLLDDETTEAVLCVSVDAVGTALATGEQTAERDPRVASYHLVEVTYRAVDDDWLVASVSTLEGGCVPGLDDDARHERQDVNHGLEILGGTRTAIDTEWCVDPDRNPEAGRYDANGTFTPMGDQAARRYESAHWQLVDGHWRLAHQRSIGPDDPQAPDDHRCYGVGGTGACADPSTAARARTGCCRQGR